MLRSIHCISVATALLLSCQIVSAIDDFGVGFHLALEYGVASVYFPNRSTVDIAKIPGGPSYQQIMRAAYVPGTTSNYIDPKLLRGDRSKSRLRTVQKFLHLESLPNHLQSLRNHLPYQLGGNDSPSQLIVPMLKALKSATESYLETTISTAGVVIPFYITKDFIEIINSAAFSASFSIPGSVEDPSGILAMRPYGVGIKPCSDMPGVDDDPDQLILTVEYSRAALTALLLLEGCGVIEEKRILHDTDLGSRQGGSESYQEKLEISLKNLVRLPMEEGGNGADLKHINNLILLGESAGDPYLREALQKVLGERYERLVVTTTSQSSSGAIDPLFAGSRGAAFNCWDRISSPCNDDPMCPI